MIENYAAFRTVDWQSTWCWRYTRALLETKTSSKNIIFDRTDTGMVHWRSVITFSHAHTTKRLHEVCIHYNDRSWDHFGKRNLLDRICSSNVSIQVVVSSYMCYTRTDLAKSTDFREAGSLWAKSCLGELRPTLVVQNYDSILFELVDCNKIKMMKRKNCFTTKNELKRQVKSFGNNEGKIWQQFSGDFKFHDVNKREHTSENKQMPKIWRYGISVSFAVKIKNWNKKTKILSRPERCLILFINFDFLNWWKN